MKQGPSSDNATPAADEPPRIAQQRGRIVLLGSVGAAVAILLIVVVFNIDSGVKPADATNADIIELIPPAPLTADDIAGELTRSPDQLRDLGAVNTWIQTTKDGKLAQQYRFASHDPNPEGLPPGWSKVIGPEIQVFISDDRVMTLQSETALLRVQGQMLESGRMTGNVVIRFYRFEPETGFDPATTEPTLETLTAEAFYDNILGEVRCDGDVDIQTATAHLPGTGLRIQINEVESRIEWLRMQTVGEIRLAAIEDESDSSSTPAAEATTPQRQTPRGQRRGGALRQANAPAADQPPFYRLTLHKDVHLQQGDQHTGWVADGDDLHIVFSMESDSLGRSLTLRNNTPQHTANAIAMHQEISTLLLTMMIAATPDNNSTSGLFVPSDDDIIVTCREGLTMVPLTNAADFPNSADDARLELVGTPLRMKSFADGADIVGQSLTYNTQRQRVIVKGTPKFPLLFESAEVSGSADAFWLNRVDRTGGFNGEGWMVMRQIDEQSPAPSLSPAPPAQSNDESPDNLRVEWQTRVNMNFAAAASDTDRRDSIGQLKDATFHGNVEVTTDEIFLRADRIRVGLPTETVEPTSEDTTKAIEFIIADGEVRAVSLTDQGTLSCKSLDVRFMQTADGRTAPSLMIAEGNVAAFDHEKQSIWTDRLEIAFMPAAPSPTNTEPSSTTRQATAQVKTVAAINNVQVLLADGARAFADRLDADAGKEIVTLTGEDVMVINGRSAIHQGTSLQLHKANNSATWPGAGRFAYFTTDLVSVEPVRIDRPDIDQLAAQNPVQVRAAWSDSMTFNGETNEGAGSLHIVGNVSAESSSDPLQLNTLSSHALTMHFINAPEELNQAAAIDAQAAQPVDELANGSRQLKQFIAEGNSKLENRTWINADRSDTPRIFYVAGPHVTYDDQTFEAIVQGAGELLVRDDRVDANDAPQPNEADGQPFSGKGTTLFRWNDRLHMKRKQGAMYDIEMLGGVQVRHMSLDQSISTMTGNRLFATVERSTVGDGDAPDEQRLGAFDLGGSMELRRLVGEGTVYIHSPTRDIDCERFDYDYATSIAMISALPGRTVLIKTVNNPNPLRAASVIWNIAEDKITATNLRGNR